MTRSKKPRATPTRMTSRKSVKFKFSALLFICSLLSPSAAISETKKPREIFQHDIYEKKEKRVFPYDIKESQEKQLDRKNQTQDGPRNIGNIRLGMNEKEFRKLYPKQYKNQARAEHDQNLMGFGPTLLPYRSEQTYPEGKLVTLGERGSEVKTIDGLRTIARSFRVEFWNDYLYRIEVKYPEFSESDLIEKYGKPSSWKNRVSERQSLCTRGNGVVSHKKQADNECNSWISRETYAQWCTVFRGFSPTPFNKQPPPCSGSVGHREISYLIKDPRKDEIVRAAYGARRQSEQNTRKRRAKNSKDF